MFIFFKCFSSLFRFSNKLYFSIFLLMIVSSTHISEVKNPCFSKINSFVRYNQSVDILYYNDQLCKIYEKGTTCHVITSSISSKIELSGLELQQTGEDLWVQLIVTPTFGLKNTVLDPKSIFILKLSLVLEHISHCYEIWISSSISEEPFSLPCIQIKAPFHTNLVYLFTSFYKDKDESSEEIVFSEEGNYSLLETSEVQTLKSWNLDFRYEFDDLKFYVILQIPVNMTYAVSYNVSLHQAGRNAWNSAKALVYQWIGKMDNQSSLSLSCSKKRLEYFKKYCISISLKPHKPCNEKCLMFKQTLYFQNVPEESMFSQKPIPDFICQNWNVTVSVIGYSDKKSITVSLSLCKGMERLSQCFDYYELYLQTLKNVTVDRIKRFKMSFNETVRKEFKNVNYDHYRVFLIPCSVKKVGSMLYEQCHVYWTRHSGTISVRAPKQVPAFILGDSNQSKGILTIVLAYVFILTSVIGLVLMYCRSKKNSIKSAMLKEITQGVEERHELLRTSIEIYILYFHDPITKMRVEELTDFLKDCCHFNVILDDDVIDNIIPNPSLWWNELLRYKCSKLGDICNSNRRFIFIETKEATRYFEYQIENFKSLSTTGTINSAPYDFSREGPDFELERSWFCQAVSTLQIDWKKCLQDYCHLFVVRFGNRFEGNAELPITRHDRYHIPRDLVKLCLNLGYNGGAHTNSAKEELLRCISTHPIKDSKWANVKS